MSEPKFWTCYEEAEVLCCDSVEEAVAEWLDERGGEDAPDEIEVHGFTPMELPKPEFFKDDVLALVLDRLDEEYGDPDGNTEEASEAMKAAAHAFLTVVLSEYEPWMCERTITRTVKVADYLTHEPRP